MWPEVAHASTEIAHAGVLIVMTVFMIPISAIVLGIGSKIVKTICQSQERRLQMRLEASKLAAGLSDDVVQDLRAEIARLRDTTTEHSLSLQHAVDRLEQRIEYLERQRQNTATYRPESTHSEPVRLRTGRQD